MSEEANKIQIIIAFPRNKTRYGYYINNNLNDKYSMDRDDFYFFVASMLQPPNTVKARQMIDHNQYFLIDFENQEIYTLKPSEKDRKEGEDQARKSNDVNKIVKEWKRKKRQEQRNQENSLYEKDIETLQKKALDFSYIDYYNSSK